MPVTEPGVDDGRARLHVLDRRLRHVEIAIEIGLERGVEMLRRDVLEFGGVILERGVVDQHVQPAEPLHGAGDGGAAMLAVRDVAGNEDAALALRFHHALRLLGVPILAQIGDGDVCALAGEEHRHGAADA